MRVLKMAKQNVAYEKPVLVVYGSVTGVTQGTCGTASDSGGQTDKPTNEEGLDGGECFTPDS